MLIAEMEFRWVRIWPKRASHGMRVPKMTILRPSYHGDWKRNFRVLEANIPWGKEQDRTAGKQRKRDRVRYLSFQNRERPRCGFIA